MVSGVDSESSSARCDGAQARSASASSSDFPRDVVRLKSGPEGKCRQGEMPLPHTLALDPFGGVVGNPEGK